MSMKKPSTVTVLPYEEGVFDSVCSEFSEKIYSHSIGKNRFATFLHEGNLIHVCEYPGREEVRKVVCPLPEYATLPEKSGTYEKKNTTVLYQIDVDNRRVDCGMSYVFHLADGRFFIMDGGYFTVGECDRLYTFLRKLQPEGVLHVAGWFFSHAHQDHFGAFLDFISKYRNECQIDMLYYTFPSLSLPEAVRWKQSDNATMREFDYTLDRLLPDVKQCHLHTGQVFSLADLDIEVLFTHEDIYPDPVGSFNDTSTVLRTTYAGQTICFLGDLQDASCHKLEAMYGEVLKSDIVQVAHHGFNGSTIETYDLISPEVALWPTATYAYNNNLERKVNVHLITMECIKEHIIAGFSGTRKIPLPYVVGTSEEIELPKL